MLSFLWTGLASRIVVTSRNQNVVTGDNIYTHAMEVLHDSQSWELLLKRTGIKDRKSLEDVGSKILRRCNGLPLAITVVAPLLMDPSVWKWEKVLRTSNSHISTGESKLEAVIDLSYDNLPAPIRVCFLCASFFPVDTKIRANKMVQYWAALGLLPEESEEETQEEIGYRYLEVLLNRNMVQAKAISGYDRVTLVTVHDVLYHYSILRAKEERGFWILRPEVSSRKMEKARHAVVDVEMVGSTELKEQRKHIRFLSFQGNNSQLLKFEDSGFYWSKFHLLKILDFEDLEVTLTDAIGHLKALKFLGLRRSKIKEVPDGLGRLEKLEVLDLKTLIPFNMNNCIRKLEALRHQYMSIPVSRNFVRVDTLKHLETLTGLDANHLVIPQLEQLKCLRKLGLHWRSEPLIILFPKRCASTLAKLDHLYSLSLSGFLPELHGLKHLAAVLKLKLSGEFVSSVVRL